MFCLLGAYPNAVFRHMAISLQPTLCGQRMFQYAWIPTEAMSICPLLTLGVQGGEVGTQHLPP